ncbi:SusC/RagA family TonB-linked outer membrane protein [Sphingobacterium sp. DK4209]|uniref:SusC/RagA family TonB-linked outer membrane protein n=1 Tax=Sphingobacterium zhuxiongii TaxID=2662364 RepID=A0A5Q0QG65_9SPHI|nr:MULTISPECIES: SusC/RagA family TonB-linked outer membrane protein [unclassified Sphingobacterium]MVZ66175.1 SusC/RagA family TonB-linked outer membrane protein [Sphingobacterium sp. DK4209]QGA26592.1 SusC/RagA family TonB-linked outer membrane protein [Sphingobacterium sp. dk4302]
MKINSLFYCIWRICVIALLIISFAVPAHANNHSKQTFQKHLADVRGRIVGEDGRPLSGATVSIKGRKGAINTGADGEFILKELKGEVTIIVSYLGYKQREIRVSENSKDLLIKMELNDNTMEDVVVTGIFERKKEAFSGATKTINAEQIKEIGNKNVLQALKTLDPSLTFVDNNQFGSNPNSLARIELRGKTSISNNTNLGTFRDQLGVDPNMPLIILDGFESSLRQITDLDINRIASVTILKDASSTALYGAKSANGVIVVETVKPKQGQVMVSYNADVNFNIADLSDFNMMNSEEKLEFERLAGRFESPWTWHAHALTQFYNERLTEVRKGVNTYWLNEPIEKVAVENRHSIQVSGGTPEIQYSIGGNYQDINGVMKGSGRNNWGANVDLSYRKNRLNITNRVFASGYRSDESPYGSFSQFTRANPYYRKDRLNQPFLERAVTGFDQYRNVPNPMYNAMLNSYDYGNGLTISNNLGFNYDLNPSLRLSGGLQLSKGSNSNVSFLSPLNTYFEKTEQLLKGSYTNSSGEFFRYAGNLAATYSKRIQERHVVTGNLRADISQDKQSSRTFTAVGFPEGVEGNPAFSYTYEPNAKPYIFEPPLIRRLSALASFSYVYDNRYFIDGTYRLDGSTAFGTENKYSPFWAVGAGWSLHNEGFIKNNTDKINSLILRANIGTSGNQSFGSFLSANVYNLSPYSNYFGIGFIQNQIGNPMLEWQKTFQSSLGLELVMFENRLSSRINLYRKVTDPLIVAVDLPSSNGTASYPMNLGSLAINGMEVELGFSPIVNKARRIVWNVGLTGSLLKGKYGEFGSIINSLNDEQISSSSIQRYEEGRSPDDLWAYKSLGIDPSNGKEVFLTAADSYTYDYFEANYRVVGNARPMVEGVLSNNLRLKNFTLNASIRYNLGSSRFNNALYALTSRVLGCS